VLKANSGWDKKGWDEEAFVEPFEFYLERRQLLRKILDILSD